MMKNFTTAELRVWRWLRNMFFKELLLHPFYCPIVDCGSGTEGAGRGLPTPGNRNGNDKPALLL